MDWLRGVDLNHRPLGYEPFPSVSEGDWAWLTPYFPADVAPPSYPESHGDRHTFGHTHAQPLHLLQPGRSPPAATP